MPIKISQQLYWGPRPDDLMDREGLAKFLNVHPRTIDRHHALKTGPKRIKIGNKIYYRASAVMEWLRQNESAGQASEGAK